MKRSNVKVGDVYRTSNRKYVVVTNTENDKVTYLVVKANKISRRNQPGKEYTVKRLSFIGNFNKIDFELGNLQIW